MKTFPPILFEAALTFSAILAEIAWLLDSGDRGVWG
jgi:hypothetical protein